MPFQKGSKQNVKKRPSVAKSQLTTFFRTDTQLEQQEMQKISQIVFQHFVKKIFIAYVILVDNKVDWWV